VADHFYQSSRPNVYEKVPVLARTAFLLISCEKEELHMEAQKSMSDPVCLVCHQQGGGGFNPIQVPLHAVQAHLNHGDYLPDADGDGYTAIGSCTGTMNDCDDSDSSVHPGAEEICYDGVDNNCNGGYSDGGCETCPCYSYEELHALYTDNLEDYDFAFFYNATEPVNGYTALILRLNNPVRELYMQNHAYVEQEPVTYACTFFDILHGGFGTSSFDNTEGQYLACNEINFRIAQILGCGMEQG
jgi:hypothetical protein